MKYVYFLAWAACSLTGRYDDDDYCQGSRLVKL